MWLFDSVYIINGLGLNNVQTYLSNNVVLSDLVLLVSNVKVGNMMYP